MGVRWETESPGPSLGCLSLQGQASGGLNLPSARQAWALLARR